MRYRINFAQGQVGNVRTSRRDVLQDYDINSRNCGSLFIQVEIDPDEWRCVDIEALRKGRTITTTTADWSNAE